MCWLCDKKNQPLQIVCIFCSRKGAKCKEWCACLLFQRRCTGYCSHGRNYKDSEKNNNVADITVHYTPEEVSIFGEVDNMLVHKLLVTFMGIYPTTMMRLTL